MPLILAATIDPSDINEIGGVCLLLMTEALGVFLIVKSGSVKSTFDALLQSENFTPANKVAERRSDKVGSIYWPIITAIYLGYSFLTSRWEISQVIWPVAGVLFGAIEAICFATKRN